MKNIICNKKINIFENQILQKLEESKIALCFNKKLEYTLVVNQEDLINDFGDSLTFSKRKTIGGFCSSSENITSKIEIWEKYRREAFPHEIGHFIHYNLPNPLKEKIQNHFNLIKDTPKLYDWDRENVNEYFADSFKYFIINDSKNMRMKDPILYGILSSLFNPLK